LSGAEFRFGSGFLAFGDGHGGGEDNGRWSVGA
jgi:hypothetical protein